MKMGVLFFSFIFFLSGFFANVSAAENWTIENFFSTIEIQNNGVVKIVEKIGVNFDSEKHGIFRDIPVTYTNSDGSKLYTKIEVESVTDGQKDVPYETSNNGDYLEIKIGDRDKIVSGDQKYEITYLASGVLSSFEDHDELYWNVTGNQWEVSISQAEAVVSLPSESLKQASCFEGAVGSTTSCRFEKISNSQAKFSTTASLESGEGLTIVVGFQKGMVPIIPVAKPRTAFDDLFSPFNLGAFAITLILGLAAAFWTWYKKGRDSWNRRRFIDDPQAVEEVKPLGAFETIVVEYSPPENLRPAEIGALLDERADSVDVTATIVDLATRGFLQIEEIEKSWAFGKVDYKLIKKKEAKGELMDFEKELFDRLFDGKQEVKISSLKEKFYKDLKVVKNKIYEHLVEKNLFFENPQSVRNKYLLIGVAIFVAGGLIIASGFIFTFSFPLTLGAAIVLSAIGFLIVSQLMPRKTPQGREMFRRSKGYLLFISTAEKHRQKFFENKNMFNEVLPYAIALGLVGKFAAAFKEMGLEPGNTSWYVGAAVFNPVAFGKSVNSFSSSFSSAIAASPSSSGFSGGSSGGGFGGGGGGSW